jgi:hypothetical protein
MELFNEKKELNEGKQGPQEDISDLTSTPTAIAEMNASIEERLESVIVPSND